MAGKLENDIKVLIMDDEDIIIKVCSGMLKYLGYKVEVSRDGAEAVKLYKKAKKENEPFGLVILDLTIPDGMGAEDTIKKILKIEPSAKVILSSGFSNDPIVANYRDVGFRGIINKPYGLDDLSKIIKDVLYS